MKKSLISFLCGALSMAMFGGGAVALASGAWKTINVIENDITVIADGKHIAEDNFVYDDRTYLPLRAVAEAIGKEVTYDETTNTAYIGSAKVSPSTPPTPVTPPSPEPTKSKTSYYSGYSSNIPDYTSVTGVELKERIDLVDASFFLYPYTNAEDVVKYEKELKNAGFLYLGEEDGSIYYCNPKYGISITLYSTLPGFEGDLQILIMEDTE